MEIEFGAESRNLLLPLAAHILPWSGWFVFAGSSQLILKSAKLREAMEHEGTADRMFKSNSADDAFFELARQAGMPEHEAGNFFHDLLTEAETDTCSEFYEALHPDNPEEVDLDAFLPMWNY